jgi:hypothetical protein
MSAKYGMYVMFKMTFSEVYYNTATSSLQICPLGTLNPIPQSSGASYFQQQLIQSLELTPSNLGMGAPMPDDVFWAFVTIVLGGSALVTIIFLLMRKIFPV